MVLFFAVPTALLFTLSIWKVHASKTEDFLTSQSLTEPDLVVRACEVLTTEVTPDAQPQDASPQYRASLAESLLFKVEISRETDRLIGYPVILKLTTCKYSRAHVMVKFVQVDGVSQMWHMHISAGPVSL